MSDMLHLFYAEPDPDRWLPYDRYPRRIVRALVRGRRHPGGHKRVFLNLRAGLDRLGVRYRVNDFGHAARHPDELVCIIGQPVLLDARRWKNPILFGSAMFSHPVDDPRLFERLPVRRILVPGEWCRLMFEDFFGDRVAAWPVGIDTDRWAPLPTVAKDIDVLVYDKIRWRREEVVPAVLEPVLAALERRGLRTATLRYGGYREEDFERLLQRSRSMVFLCEHETQGIAYLQALATGVPVFAWDRQGEWRDPTYHPHRVRFAPVTSVPYWDARCGMTFADADEFAASFDLFLNRVWTGAFTPRDYILEHLTLERCARAYLRHVAAARDARRVVAPDADSEPAVAS